MYSLLEVLYTLIISLIEVQYNRSIVYSRCSLLKVQYTQSMVYFKYSILEV